MKRKFRITIKGESYEVEVEEIEEAGAGTLASSAEAPPLTSEAPPAAVAQASPLAPEASPAPAKAPPAPAIKPPPARVAAEEVITFPMPGTVVSIKVNVGDWVKKGAALLTLDSMKMDNVISAPRDGRIKEIFVSQGSYVRRAEPLIAIAG